MGRGTLGVSNCMIYIKRDEQSRRPPIWKRLQEILCPHTYTSGKRPKRCIVCSTSHMSHALLCCNLTCNRQEHKPLTLAWYCRCKIRPIVNFSSSQDLWRSIHRQRTRRDIFLANSVSCTPSGIRSAGVHGEGNPLCAFPVLMENNATNGANKTSAKRMSGCVKCRPLAHLWREVCGSIAEIEGRICSPSVQACQATQTHFLVRAAMR